MDPYSAQIIVLNQLGYFSGIFFKYIISCLYALALLVVGLVAAELIKYFSSVLLRVLGWNSFCDFIGLSRVLQKVRGDMKPSAATAEVFFWLVLLAFFMKALVLTNINALSWIGRAFFDNFGSVVQAGITLLASLLLSHWLARTILLWVREQTAWFGAQLARALVISLGIFSALQTLGLEREPALYLTLILFGSIALGLAWSWARQQAGSWQQVIRIEDDEEGVAGS